MPDKTIYKLLDFISDSPTAFHAVDTMKNQLTKAGYDLLQEGDNWNLQPGGRYMVTRNLSSLIAFRIPENLRGGFHIIASHSDSPAFKIKENPEMETAGMYVRLNVEKYGGMLMAPWMDRPLSVAGRLLIKEGETLTTKLVNIDRDLLLIPNLAIHMNREANNGYAYNPQKDMLPLYGSISSKDTFFRQVAEAADVEPEQIQGHDLYLYSRMPGTIWGAENEFLSSGRLDDLQCAFASLSAFLSSDTGYDAGPIPAHCVLDNEEVGSSTRQGAASTFLKDTLERICLSLSENGTEADYLRMLTSSFMLSADNAHALHPNHADKADPTNQPAMNKGIVIKYNASQKYTTDAVSASVFKAICQQAKVPYQSFFNRSDMTGGSTLGNIAGNQVPVSTVDIGLPQLAMHSPYETAGALDTDYFIRAAEVFFRSRLTCPQDGIYRLETV